MKGAEPGKEIFSSSMKTRKVCQTGLERKQKSSSKEIKRPKADPDPKRVIATPLVFFTCSTVYSLLLKMFNFQR